MEGSKSCDIVLENSIEHIHKLKEEVNSLRISVGPDRILVFEASAELVLCIFVRGC
jgi:hypothetical protein